MEVNPVAAQAPLDRVRDDVIEFVSMRPPGSRRALLERKIVVTEPAEVVALAGDGDARTLDALVGLLQDSSRSWAAFVVLAAMTGRHAKVVDTYATDRAGWYEIFGPGAHAEWRAWLDGHRGALEWDREGRQFVLRSATSSGD